MLVGFLLADVAPSIWRDIGLKSVYKALKEDFHQISSARLVYIVICCFEYPRCTLPTHTQKTHAIWDVSWSSCPFRDEH
ncbi:hypothetical protein BDR03DRAFT_222558 [Suillus americanus]|nr:hypothetical protein BDR03DRAFT_222558 [Suillus americanus]